MRSRSNVEALHISYVARHISPVTIIAEFTIHTGILFCYTCSYSALPPFGIHPQEQMHLAVRRTERCSIHRHATRSMTSVGHQPVHFVCGVTLFKYISAATR